RWASCNIYSTQDEAAVELTELTKEQAEYLGVDVAGPCKPAVLTMGSRLLCRAGVVLRKGALNAVQSRRLAGAHRVTPHHALDGHWSCQRPPGRRVGASPSERAGRAEQVRGARRVARSGPGRLPALRESCLWEWSTACPAGRPKRPA